MPAQQAPLTAEYQALFEASLKDQAAGGQGLAQANCVHFTRHAEGHERLRPDGGDRHAAHHLHHGRARQRQSSHLYRWTRLACRDLEPTFLGYSIGTWIDTDGDGRYDVLEVETRDFNGPRTFDDSGIPLHAGQPDVVKERIYLDKSDPDVFHDEVTVIDHALTRPWVVTKSYRREPDRRPYWREVICAETNNHVEIGKQDYLLSPDGQPHADRKGPASPGPAIFQSLPEAGAVGAIWTPSEHLGIPRQSRGLYLSEPLKAALRGPVTCTQVR